MVQILPHDSPPPIFFIVAFDQTKKRERKKTVAHDKIGNDNEMRGN